MRKLLIVGLLILQILLVNAFGQEKTRPQDELGCATVEGKQLSFLVGKWKVKSKFRKGDGWEETVGTAKIKFVIDKCLVQEKLNIKRDGKPLTVLAMYSYNNFTKNYQWIFAHSEHGLITLYEGGLEKDSFTLKYTLDLGSRKILFERHLTKTKQGFNLTAKRSFDEGKTWRDDWYLEYYQ